MKIDPTSYAALQKHAEDAFPNECCGALLGHFGDAINAVVAAIPCPNARQDSPRNRYSIAPLDLVRIQRDARNQGLDIVGFYHSHPDHPAQWSSTDLAEAYWLGCSYLITSVISGKLAETRSFRLTGLAELRADQKRFEEESIEITESSRR